MTEDDRIDFGKSKIDPLFNSIFYPTLLSMVFASLFTVAPTRHVARCSCYRMYNTGCDTVDK